MSGRPWYSFYPDAYERDAGHLSYVQDSAYRRMLDLYYKSGQALSHDHAVIYRSCRAMRREERAAIDYCLGQFFELHPDGYHNRRADSEIAKAEGISVKRSAAASKRHSKHDANAHAIAEQLDTHSTATSTATSSLRSDNTSGVASRPPPDLGPEFIRLPTNRYAQVAEEVPVYEAFIVELQASYASVDVREQLLAMRAWLLSNDRQRKTKTGMKKFINGWLSRAHDKNSSQATIFKGNFNGQRPGRQSSHDNHTAGAALAIASLGNNADGRGETAPDRDVDRPQLPLLAS